MNASARAGGRARAAVRQAVRIVAAAAVAAGLSMLGYGAYRIWIAETVTPAAQEQLATEYSIRVSGDPGTPIAISTTSPGGEEPVSDVPVMIDPGSDRPVDVAPSSMPGVSVPADVIVEAAPAIGEPIGRILIPDIGVDWWVVQGVEPSELASGPGHMPGTPLPGQPGNAVISGHRTTNGAPFFDLDLLGPGTLIAVETAIGRHVYRVDEVVIVAPTDLWVTQRRDGAWLTLTTCHPKYSSRQRLVVFSVLVGGPNWPAALQD